MAGYYQSFGSWNRTYNSLQGAMTTCLCCSDQAQAGSCGAPGSVFADFPSGVTTCAQAVQFIADDLRKKLAAPYVAVQAGSVVAYILTLRLSSSVDDTATVQLQIGSNCTYPIGVRWNRAKRFSSGLSSFNSKDALLGYLVQQLRR